MYVCVCVCVCGCDCSLPSMAYRSLRSWLFVAGITPTEMDIVTTESDIANVDFSRVRTHTHTHTHTEGTHRDTYAQQAEISALADGMFCMCTTAI